MRNTAALVTVAVGLALVESAAQTRVTPPDNKYTPAQDVQMGLDAAKQIRGEIVLMKDDLVTGYVETLGQRLVAAIPTELRNDEFKYTFETVNVKELNAFALPGGPMFVNRGIIEAANTEGEIAGVMAHEISHVVLRHGTAQMTKRQGGTGFLGGLGRVAGAVVGGAVGEAISVGSQVLAGGLFLRFSRDFEKQADLEGVRIMAAAGYDPRDMANMFRTLEKQGSSGAQILSDHPNPGNRVEYITKEAAFYPVASPIGASATFDRVRDRLKTAPLPASQEGSRTRTETNANTPDTVFSETVEAPAARYTEYRNDTFRISVPTNWRQFGASSNSVTFAPSGAYGTVSGHTVFTHGVELGLSRATTDDLSKAMDAFVESLAQSNPRMSRPTPQRSIVIDGRRYVQVSLSNVSEANRREEAIQIVATQLRTNTIFYAIAVAPRAQLGDYEETFQKVLASLKVRQ